jgi:hypothetical protein
LSEFVFEQIDLFPNQNKYIKGGINQRIFTSNK